MDICLPVCMSQEKPRTTEWLILQFLIYHKMTYTVNILKKKAKKKNVWLCSYKKPQQNSQTNHYENFRGNPTSHSVLPH